MIKVAVKLDGVLANQGYALTSRLRELCLINPAQSTDNIEYQYWTTGGIDGVVDAAAIREIEKDPVYWALMPPYPNVASWTYMLSLMADVHIISGRFFYPGQSIDTTRWLDRFGFHYKHHVLLKPEERVDYIKDNDIAICMDDSLGMASDLAPYTHRVYVVDRVYNREGRNKLPEDVIVDSCQFARVKMLESLKEIIYGI